MAPHLFCGRPDTGGAGCGRRTRGQSLSSISPPVQSLGGNGEDSVEVAGLGDWLGQPASYRRDDSPRPLEPTNGVRSHGSSLPSAVRAKAQRDTTKCRQTLLPSSTTVSSAFAPAVAAGSAPRPEVASTSPNSAVNMYFVMIDGRKSVPHPPRRGRSELGQTSRVRSEEDWSGVGRVMGSMSFILMEGCRWGGVEIPEDLESHSGKRRAHHFLHRTHFQIRETASAKPGILPRMACLFGNPRVWILGDHVPCELLQDRPLLVGQSVTVLPPKRDPFRRHPI